MEIILWTKDYWLHYVCLVICRTMVGIILWLLPLMELVIASSKLSLAFDKFQNESLIVQGNHIQQNVDSLCVCSFHGIQIIWIRIESQ